jgi:hypothetical protein
MSLVLNVRRSSRALPGDPALRGVTAVGLVTIGVIHALQIQGQLSGAVWLTVGFCLLAGVAPLAGLWLLAQPTALSWGFCGLVSLLAGLGYILTRSVAVPGDPGDKGNWLEPLGLAALIVEWLVVFVVALALSARNRTAPGIPAPAGTHSRQLAHGGGK